MTEIESWCFKCKRIEHVETMVVNNDGVDLTFDCGYGMKKFWKPDL